MERLTTVDRNILRVAVFEMFHATEVPPIVAINEAIEIAKRLGGPDSGRFVNGVLDRLKEEVTRPLREPARTLPSPDSDPS
jgi:N utilization substance protein B